METTLNIFSSSGVPIRIVAKVYGKDPAWVRKGILDGWLPIGVATRNGKQLEKGDTIDGRRGRINYYISPIKLYQETGYVWEGKE